MRYNTAMRLLADWKWYAALAVLALFTALVVWLPRPQAAPAATAKPPSPIGTADMPPGRPEPTPAELDAMLQYSVQEGDTAAGIARLFRTSEEDLRWANHIPDAGDLTAGVKIWLPPP